MTVADLQRGIDADLTAPGTVVIGKVVGIRNAIATPVAHGFSRASETRR
jgi:hypothetical protein